MRKVILALARSSLVAAFCCSVSFAQTAETSRAGSVTRSPGADSRLPQSPRELLKRGKDLFLQGHHAKALEVLEQVPPDANLSETDSAQLAKLLEATRKKVESLPGRRSVTTRAQSPDAFGGAEADSEATAMMATLKKEARRLADAEPGQRKAAAIKWIATARSAFNQGDVDDAEQIAQLASQIQATFKATEDSPEKLLADLQECRKQEAAWKNDRSSPQAKRNRSNYLLRRAQQVAQQGDSESAQRFLADAEQIQVTPGVLDLKPAQVRQQLEGLGQSAAKTSSRTTQTANRPTRNSGIEQVGFEEPAAPVKGSKDSPEAMRVKADKALHEAQLAERLGRFKDAWRLAAAAQKLEVEGGLKYRAGEERPSQYIAGLMQRMPDDLTSLALMEKEVAQGRAAAEEDVEFARAMIASAKEDMQKGDLLTAREKLEHVVDLKIKAESLGERPEALLEQLDRNAITTASRTKARATSGATSQTAARGANPNKAKAMQLLAEAKEAMATGDLEQARAKTLAANQIKVAYDVLEETPHQLMAQIDDAAMSSKGDGKMLANKPAATAEDNPFATETAPRTTAATGVRTGRRASGLPMPAQKQRAIELLELSRAELKAGRIDDAKRLANEAREINTVYALFEDRPELVLADIELAEASVPTGPGTGRRANLSKDDRNIVQVANESREPDLAKRQAVMLLKQARLDLKAGRLKEAEEKARQAEKLDAGYTEFEDKPTMVLKELERAHGLVLAKNAMDEVSSENPFDSTTPEGVITQAGGAEVAVINPNGSSAADYYRDGKLAMRRGERAEAYHLFLQAYQSGEQLPPRTKQQLEDFLQQLSPKSNKAMANKIQLASGDDSGTLEEAAPTLETESTAEGAAPNALDRVDQHLAVKLDALRTQVMNSIFRADRAREKNPEEALKILDKAQQDLENADLSKEQVAPLLRSVTRARELAQGSMQEQKHNLDQTKHNQSVKEAITKETRTKIRIEQEFADLTQQFNDLLKQRRYAEAELIAKKARELDPENPAAEVMKWKAKFAMRNASNDELKDRKEEGFLGQLDSVEWSAIPFDDRNPIVYAKNWAELSNRRKKFGGPDNRSKTEEEKRIEKSLSRQVSMHFESEPLQSVINKLAVDSNINFRLDPQGLEEVQVDSNTPITINVDGIQMKSALNLILEPLHLGYAIRDEVLKITSIERQKGDLEVRVYPVADLVIPIPNFANSAPLGSLNAGNSSGTGNLGGAPFNVSATKQRPAGQAFAQVQDGFGAPAGAGTAGIVGERRIPEGMRRASQADFDSLMELVVSTVEPSSWVEVGGEASVKPFETTLSLVIRQTQQAHEEIQDLLAQLRRLQDLQVSIEVRFVTVSDKFFERIGVDFDFNVQGTAPVNNVNSQFGDFLPPYGGGRVYTNAGATTGTTTTGSSTSGTTTSGTTTSGTTTSGTTSGTSTSGVSAGTGAAPFAPGPPRDLTRRGDYPKLGTIVGLERQLQFSNDLQIPFRQGSFDVGIPDFGSFKPDAGLSMGFAILSDIETFFFIQAAQGDSRSNILFAPKVTLFNGQLAQVEDNLRRPFVVGQTPVVGAFTVAFAPNVQIFTEGVTLLVTAVVSADRRYVRLSLVPDFRSITDVFTFTFSGTGGTAGGNSGGSSTGFQGGGSSIGGGGSSTGSSSTGSSSGGSTTSGSTTSGSTTSGSTTSGSTTSGSTGQNFGSVPATQTVQQPVQEVISIQTSVSVPDGGTVLLGGIKRLKEGRNMAGVPILNKIPYISRLFKNSGVGRETDSLMMMVTPRIIIQEEEEELLGVPL
ncbi:MAG: hypothetical protein V4719_27895 [Planctomycetota bacterium]